MNLTELGYKHGTDKANHEFTKVYESFFSKYKNPTILEIGVYNGGSLKMLNEFYESKCTIVGMDCSTQLAFTTQGYPNMEIFIGDQENEDDMLEIVKIHPLFDIIIDDASHKVHHQQKSFDFLFPHLKSGGIYVMEDLHTSFHTHYNPLNIITSFDFLNKLKNKENPNSPLLSEQHFQEYIKEIEFIEIYRTRIENPDKSYSNRDSITSIIKKL